MKTLLVGGAGFIGSHVADALLAQGHEVVVLDNFSSGKKENLPDTAKLIEADITDFARVQAILAEEKPEAVYHFAAQIDVRKSVTDPIFDAETNIMAGINLIKSAHESGVKKFIFSSTGGAIYGETEERPTKEDHPEWPLSPYGIGKLTTDKYLNYYHAVHGLKFVSLRYANVYGPRQNPHGEAGVVAIFINKMLQGQNPMINGDGSQTRDYVFVKDVARANALALEYFDITGVYNVGTGRETSVNELFRILNGAFQNAFQELHAPAKAGEQMTSSLDASKIQAEFTWKSEIALEGGLAETVKWFREGRK